MKNEIRDFLDYLTYERNVSVNTIGAYRDDLESFTGFLCNQYFTLGRDLLDLRRVDHLAIRSYLAHLARKKLSRSSTARHLSALRSFFKFLMREGVVDANPARAVAGPSVMGVKEIAPASRLSFAAIRNTCPPESDTPHTTSRSASTPSILRANAIAAV